MRAGSRPPAAREPRVRPLDLDLPRVARDDAAALAAWLERAPPLAVGDLARAARDLLGAPVHLAPPGPPIPAAQVRAEPDGTTLLLAPGGDAAPCCAVTVPAPLRDAVVDLVLGGDGRPGADAAAPPELARGVALFAGARLLGALGAADWRAWDAVPGPPPLSASGIGPGLLAAGPAVPGDAAARVVRVRLGERWHGVVVWTWPRTAPRPSVLPTWATDVELTLSVRGASGRLPARRLLEAAPGDVFLPDEITVERAGPDAHLRGRVPVAVAGATRPLLSCDLDAAGLRLLDAGPRRREPPATDGEVQRMDDADGSDTARETPPVLEDLAALGDAPVDVHVEIARVRLSLEALLALRPGALLATGATPGRDVVLRVGDRAVARGELVDVDGELGVRLLRVGG